MYVNLGILTLHEGNKKRICALGGLGIGISRFENPSQQVWVPEAGAHQGFFSILYRIKERHVSKPRTHSSYQSKLVAPPSLSPAHPNATARRTQLSAMAARRKPAANSTATSLISDEIRPHDPKPASDPNPPLAPPKLGFVLPLSAVLFLPFFYLVFFHYEIDHELRRSIAINASMSFAGFVMAVRLIPVAARYLLRRNMFGYDINKKGTPQGAIKVYVFLNWLKKSLNFGELLNFGCFFLGFQ